MHVRELFLDRLIAKKPALLLAVAAGRAIYWGKFDTRCPRSTGQHAHSLRVGGRFPSDFEHQNHSMPSRALAQRLCSPRGTPHTSKRATPGPLLAPSVTTWAHTACPELRADRPYHQLATTAAIDPKATLRGRARSELPAVLGAVTADALTLEGSIGSFSLTCIATQSTSERLGRSPTSIYLALVERRRAACPAGAYRAIAPDFRERSNEPIDLLIGM